MNYHNITKVDMLNGDGLRVVLWVAGCGHHCKNCHNPITWDPDGGILFDTSAENEISEELKKDYISGITLSGGDPLFSGNREAILSLSKKIKEQFPTKTIWLYTGYHWEDIHNLPIMDFVDVLVDGPFVEAEKDPKLHWKGSSNQRVIDVQKTKAEGTLLFHHT